MSEHVWVSQAFNYPPNYRRLRVMYEGYLTDNAPPEELDRRGDIYLRYKAGHGLDAADIPKAFCGINADTHIAPLPDFFSANGYFIVSGRCADVFRQFNLGTGNLYPVSLFQGDKKTVIRGDFFFLNFGCRKWALRPELSNSSSVRCVEYSNPKTYIASNIDDNDCVVDSSAFDGCDLWIDGALHLAFFLSFPLGLALKKEKLDKNINLKICTTLR